MFLLRTTTFTAIPVQLMENWDSLFPFTAEEINLFSRLHQKATKFPAPHGIKQRAEIVKSDKEFSDSSYFDTSDSSSNQQ